jgi:two-component sensor histidine kinase
LLTRVIKTFSDAKKFLLPVSISVFVTSFLIQEIAYAQADPADLSQKYAKSKPDTSRVHSLIKLSSFYLFKPGEIETDLLNVAPLKMDVSQAVPLGLILNEAITNSIKYAFPGDRDGVISISLYNTSSDSYTLTISDKVGVPANIKKTGSLGISLMKGLSEDVDGNFSVENNAGTVIRISFVHDHRVHLQDGLTTSFISTN